MHAQPKSICLINAYLPSENKEVDEQYKDTLEQISEIIQKFKDTHNMLICGDMNAYNLMLNSGKKFALCTIKKEIFQLLCCPKKKF
jgi:exonuclease III